MPKKNKKAEKKQKKPEISWKAKLQVYFKTLVVVGWLMFVLPIVVVIVEAFPFLNFGVQTAFRALGLEILAFTVAGILLLVIGIAGENLLIRREMK